MPSETDRIEKQVRIQAPRGRVWRALTDTEKLGTFFHCRLERSEIAPGKTLHGDVLEPGYEHLKFDAKIERVEPERFLSWRWHPGTADKKLDLNKEPTTLVEFRLEDVDGGTLLTVVESGFDALPPGRRDEAWRGNSEGWAEVVKTIDQDVRQTG